MQQRHLLVAVFVLPLVVLFLTAVILGQGGDAWPVAVVDEAQSDSSAAFVRSIEESHSSITPYFEVVETDDIEDARDLVESGRLQMLVRIPADFDEQRTIHVETYNINTDAMKNALLRLEHATLGFQEEAGELGVVSAVVASDPGETVWRSSFFSGSAVLLALFFGATLTAANLFAFEIEHGTEAEVMLSPLGGATAGVGTIATAVLVSWLAAVPVAGLAALAFGFSVPLARLAWVVVAMVPVQVGCAGLGLVVAHVLRRFRVVQPVIIITAIATFFGAGGFSGVNTLNPVSRSLATAWPFSRVFEWFNPVLHGVVPGLTLPQYAGLLFAGVAGLVLCWWTYRREERVAFA